MLTFLLSVMERWLLGPAGAVRRYQPVCSGLSSVRGLTAQTEAVPGGRVNRLFVDFPEPPLELLYLISQALNSELRLVPVILTKRMTTLQYFERELYTLVRIGHAVFLTNKEGLRRAVPTGA